jgi:hypothetical protein
MAAITREPDRARTLVGSYAPTPVDGESTLGAGRWRAGRAYRAGRLVCGCVHVAVRVDDRLGLTGRERHTVRVRFSEPVDDDLRAELSELARRRGTASERAAERIDPIELVIDDPSGKPERMTGRLQPPHSRHRRLREIEFGFGQLTRC